MFALGAALLVDRADRTIRDPEEAALTFSAPVLSIIPADGEEFAVIAEPNSLAAEAYRGSAAMSIATDRLPKAIMVSTPTGDAHAQVAANFAAALSRLGLKVALVAMSVGAGLVPRSVHAEPPGHGPPARAARPRAHRHASRRAWRDALPVNEYAPNLVVVPPANEPVLHLPIDGLPALLQALSDGGVDVTVIAGPPLLEEADATIVVWATRNVLWAIIPGEVTRAEAARGRRPDGAGGSHAFRRGDGRAADHRGLTVRPRCEPAVRSGPYPSRRVDAGPVGIERGHASGRRRGHRQRDGSRGSGPGGATAGRTWSPERLEPVRRRIATVNATATTASRLRRRGEPPAAAVGLGASALPSRPRRPGARVVMFERALLPAPILTRVLVPVFGLLATIAAARWLSARHPDEPWLGRLLVLGVLAKEFASILRYRTLVNSYGDVGDASVFDIYGRRYSEFWLGTSPRSSRRSTTFARATSCGGSPASCTTSSATT